MEVCFREKEMLENDCSRDNSNMNRDILCFASPPERQVKKCLISLNFLLYFKAYGGKKIDN